LENTFYEFGTLFHCLNDRSLNLHIVRAQNDLLWPVCRPEDALSIICTINCTLLKPICQMSIPQHRELVTDTRAAGQGSK